MKVLSILILTLLGALTVLAAPGPKPFPGELAMVEAREVFEGTKSSGPPGTDNKEPDSVPPQPKVSGNSSDTGKMFKRQSCPPNHWYCRSVNGCCQSSPEYRCCDFGCCPPGYYCCGADGRCHRSWSC
ncbi:hypothetical protein EV426DRAFT_612279 [Tirmania nivea]|nr:hypothetical protein EV426DRAFT_612279 [Tirmania nivea]